MIDEGQAPAETGALMERIGFKHTSDKAAPPRAVIDYATRTYSILFGFNSRSLTEIVSEDA
jgi:hypothetical protein